MIRALARFTNRLRRHQAGSMAIETAIIAPVLVTMAVGGFEVSSIVARQTELQSAVAEAAAIVRAVPPLTAEERTTVRDIMMVSTGLTAQRVSVIEIYRCGSAADYVASAALCGTSDTVNKFIRVTLNDQYDPLWAEFGLGNPLSYTVSRTIQVG